ncbi:unnamed protein product [Alopecurus aequalis]
MDGELPQQNSVVHPEPDLAIASPVDYNLMFEDLGDEWDIMLGLGENTNVGNTGDGNAAAAEQDHNGGETQSGQRTAARRFNRKRRDREQILQLEAAFRENRHPDEEQRADLGKRVGMSAPQVKFWFQNRRCAQKALDRRREKNKSEAVNAALQAEHRALRLATENNTCLTCGGPTVRVSETRRHLLSENGMLKDELQRATAFLNTVSGGTAEVTPTAMHSGLIHGPATNYNVRAAGKALATDHALPPPSHQAHAYPMMQVSKGLARSQRDTDTMLTEIAAGALKELWTLARVGTPMWLSTPDAAGEVLNLHRYDEIMFPSIFGPYRKGSLVDGTRRTGDVMCTADNLVSILMDAARWSEMFPGIVASATVSRIITAGASQQHGMMQQMDAELRVLSSRVPVRKIKFVRQCQKKQPGKWAVVDVSVDGILGEDGGDVPSPYTGSRFLPSGCLIEDINNSFCKVTWIVNMEYDESTVSALYHPLLRSGQALGACRWLASLQRQCEYLGILHSYPISADISPDGRRNIFEVAQRMTRSFYEAMCGPGAQPWRSDSSWRGGCGIGSERFEVAVRVVTFSAGGGAPGSVVLNATTTVWLPGIPAQHVFDYLCNGNRRGEWDSLANGAPVLQEGYFATGQLPGNAISVLRSLASGKLILQEARTDASCMLLAYATLDDQSMQHAMSNGGPASIYLLPSGVVVLPDAHSEPLVHPNISAASSSSSTATGHRSNTGSFVSVMYQTLLSGQPPDTPSLEAIDNAGNLLCRVIRKIKDAVRANNVIDA